MSVVPRPPVMRRASSARAPRGSRALGTMFFVAFTIGCATASAEGGVGSVHPHVAGVDRRAATSHEIAALLNDNPRSLARREKEAAEERTLALEKARDAEEAARYGGVVDGKERPDVSPLMAKATAALEAGDYATAGTLAAETVRLDGRRNPYAHVILGDVALHARDYAKALEHYKRAMELDPNDPWAVTRASQTLTKMNKPREARDLLRAFVAAHPDKVDADTYDALAWLEADTGEVKKAEEAFRNAQAKANGKDAEAYYGLAMLAARRGDAAATERALTGLFDLEPERRVVIERDPTFFRMRVSPNVRNLFTAQKMAEARAALAAKPKGSTGSIGAGGVASAGGAGGATTVPTQPTLLAIPGGAETRISDQIRFDFDSASIRAESTAVLEQVAAFLKEQSASFELVEVSGHADRQGDERYNVKLSEARARAVRDALVRRGVDATKLRIKGYGMYCPVDGTDSELAYQRNRRVQFAIAAGGKVLGETLTCNERMRRWLKPEGATAKLISLTR